MTDKERKYKYSEIFLSAQGEGLGHTGRLTVWWRTFLCSLQCLGFGQKDPTNPETYILPYQTLDISSIKRIEDLPVFDYGCDSSYSWSAKYKHLQYEGTAKEIAHRLIDKLPHKQFVDPVTKAEIMWAVTGGEPLMARSQQGFLEIMQEFKRLNNYPRIITFETNGTQPLSKEFVEWAKEYQAEGNELFFSVSPKLWFTAGEAPEKAIKMDVVKSYYDLCPNGQMKYVITTTDEAISEFEQVSKQFQDFGVDYPVCFMIAGATGDSQTSTEAADLATKLLHKGYHMSFRAHAMVWSNQLGT